MRTLSRDSRAITSVLTVTATAIATAALAQSRYNAETLLFAPGEAYTVGYRSSHDNSSLTEFVPTGQTVQDWTEMYTVRVFNHAPEDAPAFLQSVGKKFTDACPGTTVGKGGVITGTVNGYAVSMLLLSCPRNPATGKPETTAFRVIKGRDSLYSVQHAWRTQVSGQQLAEAIKTLAKVTVCDDRSADHPCPSLDSLVAPN